MSSEPTWEQARDLFLELAELSDGQREVELERLDARDSVLATWVRDLLRHDVGVDLPSGPGTPRRLGPYEVISLVGRGGMGEVFKARRADGEYEQEVAVKLLRAGSGSQELVRRFLRERQALARLDHEYIAGLLDGGKTEHGEPYLVMEFVDGERADDFAARLDLRDRLELFVRIGRAVAHAHQRGFVHRDLKPANILVRSDGMPRLLDFGIARLVTDRTDPAESPPQLTQTGHRLFTPEYASPEQIRAEVVTERSDLFALGTLLYVFLCGDLPWQGATNQHELELRICDDDPVAPSRRLSGTARSRVAGDLDAVVLHCLAKRPQDRYGSVDELCADIGRHLEGRPIHARKIGWWGRTIRFARRKPAYPIAATFLLVALVSAGIAWNAQRVGVRRQEELREAIADRVKASTVLWQDGQTKAARDELAVAWESLQELPDSDSLAVEILAQQAVYANGERDWEASLDSIARAQAILRTTNGPNDKVLLATLLNAHAYALHRSAPGDASRSASKLAYDYTESRFDPGDTLRIDAVLGWADELQREGKSSDALDTVADAVKRGLESDPRSETVCRLLNDQGVALGRLGRYEEAVGCYGRAIENLTWHRGARHPNFAKIRLNLGVALFVLGRFDGAKEELLRSLESSRILDEELFISSNQHFLGRIYSMSGDLDAAERCAREAIAIRERNDLGLFTDRSRCLLGIVLAQAGRDDEAAEVLSPILDDPRLEPGYLLPRMEAEARRRYGLLLLRAGNRGAARKHLLRAIELEGSIDELYYDATVDLPALIADDA